MSKLRLIVAITLALSGLFLSITAMEKTNPVSQFFCDASSSSFGDRGGEIGVLFICTAIIILLMTRLYRKPLP